MRDVRAPTDLPDLVARARRGDPRAVEALVRLHTPAVRAVIRDQIRNPADVEEVMQDVFARAVERLSDLKDPGRARPWILAIARNAAIDRRRVNRRRSTVSVEEYELTVRDDGPSPDVVTEVRDLVMVVRNGIGRLSPRDATVLDLVARMGFSPSEIAVALDLTVGAAKVALHRARRRLLHALVVEAAVAGVPVFCSLFHDVYERSGLESAISHAKACGHCRRLRSDSPLTFAFGGPSEERAPFPAGDGGPASASVDLDPQPTLP